MTPTQTPAVSAPVIARRPAFGRTVVDFSGTEPVAPAPVAKAPLRASKREQEAAAWAKAKAEADAAAAKAKADADAALAKAAAEAKAKAEARAKANGDFGVACGHPGCKAKVLANMAFFRGSEIRCRGHQTVGFGSWSFKKRQEEEAAKADAEVLASILRRRR